MTDSVAMKPNDIAAIQTQVFPPSSNLCYVRFFYYMYGTASIGPLRVSLCCLVSMLYNLSALGKGASHDIGCPGLKYFLHRRCT